MCRNKILGDLNFLLIVNNLMNFLEERGSWCGDASALCRRRVGVPLTSRCVVSALRRRSPRPPTRRPTYEFKISFL